MSKYNVFVRVDSERRITAVDSSAFLSSNVGWIEIDGGYGDKYHHAQGNYFEKPLLDDFGVHRYGLDDNNKPYERTQAAMDAERQEEGNPSPTLESRVSDVEDKTSSLEEALELLLSGVTE